MKWRRALFAGVALLAVLASAWGFFFLGPPRERELPLPPDSFTEVPDAGPAAAAVPAPALAPLPRLSVTVKGDAGVEVKRRGATSETGCATQGTAEPLCPGQYDVRASSPGQVALATVRLNRGDARQLALVPLPAGRLELLITDADRLPVDRVNVTAQSPSTGYVLKGRTDSDGTLALEPVTPGDWWVVAHRDGWGPAAGIATPGKTLKLQLGALGTVDGTLSPAADGVRVELLTPDLAVVAETVPDGGRFALGPVPQGKYVLRASSADFEPRTEAVSVPASNLTLRLSAGATVKGDLVGPAKERLDGQITATGPGPTRTATAQDGAFELRGLTAGRWILTSGAARAVAEVDGGATRVELIMPLFEGVIAGSCSFDGGHRMPAAVTVRAVPEKGPAVTSAACDAGSFELRGLERGFYALDVTAEEAGERWMGRAGPASTGTRDVPIVVPGVARLSYRLVDETGTELRTHTREHYEERDLELLLAAPGHVAVHRTISLYRGSATALGDVKLEKGAPISGRVLDAVTKDPISGAVMSVGGADHLTGKDGTFTSSEAAAGDVEVRFSHPRYVPLTRVTTAPGELSVELTPAARAVGELVTANGALPLGLDVWASSEQGSLLVPVERGAFATEHLADGRWLLRVVGDDASGFETVELDIKGGGNRQVVLVERAAGVTFEVETFDREGAPTPSNVLLVPRAVTAPPNEEELQRMLRRPSLIADATARPARYRFLNVAPGAYTLLANARGRVWMVALPLLVQAGMSPVSVAFEQVPYSP